MKLQHIVPWGRTLKEYRAMFLLTKTDLQGKILGCGDGPASFNFEATRKGAEVISIDPIYQFSKTEIASRIDVVASEVMEQVRANEDAFVWKNIPDPDVLYTTRMQAMEAFLSDYEVGKEQGRYRFEMLPQLSFEDASFDLALSSHFLLLYSEHLDLAFHISAIMEMLRVAKEVRIFPIITLEGKRSKYLESIIEILTQKGYGATIERGDYEFQKGGDEMLRIVFQGVIL